MGGYGQYLRVMSDPAHEEHEFMLNWRGEFDPEHSSSAEVRFDDPAQRWRVAYEDEDPTPGMKCYEVWLEWKRAEERRRPEPKEDLGETLRKLRLLDGPADN